ncbi:DUF1345 domain-containing protein [Roseiterribacter gracilis]|uniref:DUF1345 domain-containing protein n=1 Tax=Roseiterribacter gracilis TaxID=2812848 RepID=A0A8S8XHC2_9PROT|nr:hypothetical protein TMPK1_35260 [Rhodospirillales bacterium TMPK1]
MQIITILRHTFAAHARTLIGAVIGAAVGLALPDALGWPSRALLGWDVFCAVSLALIASLLRCGPDMLRERARREDEGRFIILGLLLVAALASSVAIGFAIRPADKIHGPELALYIVETAGTILLSWLLMQTLFALHYARDWYAHENAAKKHPTKQKNPPLEFPGDTLPDFSDFLYFAVTIGMTFQTSDVTVHARNMRRIVLAHAVIAFFYNTGIVALSINIVAGLLH